MWPALIHIAVTSLDTFYHSIQWESVCKLIGQWTFNLTRSVVFHHIAMRSGPFSSLFQFPFNLFFRSTLNIQTWHVLLSQRRFLPITWCLLWGHVSCFLISLFRGHWSFYQPCFRDRENAHAAGPLSGISLWTNWLNKSPPQGDRIWRVKIRLLQTRAICPAHEWMLCTQI